ncbi:MAG: UDP-N-acetylmuramoyl-tripeptide--D-alanyl-D-alanine ligase, partial [Pseudomonadota bacterium]
MLTYSNIKQALPTAKLNIKSDWTGSNIQFDSRKLIKGEVFIALKGARNGHDFVFDAVAKGASAVIIDEHLQEFVNLPTIMVENCLQALVNIGKFKRQQLSTPVIAITGSMGKTTLKQMLGSSLSTYGKCQYPLGSFNNHIGVPLTLANTPHNAKYMVLEMGMNNSGEISQLTNMGKPEIAIITTIGPVHLENLGSMANIASAKAEIFEGLTGQKIAILPIDNEYFPSLVAQAKLYASKIYTFGTHDAADIRLIECKNNLVSASIFGKNIQFNTMLSQRHLQLYQVLSMGVIKLLELPLNQAQEVISEFTAERGRGKIHKITLKDKALTIIDEAYNASPYANIVAISNLK